MQMVIIVTSCSNCQYTLLSSYAVLYFVTTERTYRLRMIRVLNVRYFSKQN
jgi:hypothetical protein